MNKTKNPWFSFLVVSLCLTVFLTTSIGVLYQLMHGQSIKEITTYGGVTAFIVVLSLIFLAPIFE